MAFKPNYNHERAERERAKQRKQQEEARRRESDAVSPVACDITDAQDAVIGETGVGAKTDGGSNGA